jgi:hypothetical protein
MNPTKTLVSVTLALLLSGCAQADPQGPVPAPETSLGLERQQRVPVPAPTTPAEALPPAPIALTPAVIVEEYRHRLQEEIQKWNDSMCVKARSLDCTTATFGLKRLSEAAALELENARPWPSEQEELADRTLSRLKAVSMLTEDGQASMSMLDSELILLDQTLQSWSAFSG